MGDAKRDANYVPTLIAVSNADGSTPVTLYADPTTHRLLVSSAAISTPAGSDTQVQFNDGGAMGGDAGFVYNKTTDTATLAGHLNAETVRIEDSNASHYLVFITTSDLTANRNLTFVPGDAARTLTISGDATISQDYSTTGNPQFATIELGAASDTTISRSSAGVIAVEGVTVALNATTATHTAGTIELGHASDTTLSRSAAGVLAVEGVDVLTTSGTQTVSNKTIALGSNTISGTKADFNTAVTDDNFAYLATAQSFTALQTFTLAGNVIRAVSTEDGASVQVVKLEGDRATMADNDEAYASLLLSNDGGTQTEFARITWVATDVNAGTSEDGALDFSVITAGTLAKELRLTGAALSPAADNGLTLGTTTLAFGSLHLNTGATINVENGDAVITHSAGIFTVSTGDLRVTTAGTNTASAVTVGGTQTLSNKTLTAPKFADAGFIADANGNELIVFQTTASAVNELEVTNGATGSPVTLAATGGDTNIGITLTPKGTGIVKGELKRFMVRLLGSTTDQTVANAVGGDYRISNRAITVKAIGSYCDTAGTTGTYTVDINEAGTTILSTKVTVDSTEKSSETAATAAVISDSAIAADAIITFDVDAIQTTAAKGLIMWIDYIYA